MILATVIHSTSFTTNALGIIVALTIIVSFLINYAFRPIRQKLVEIEHNTRNTTELKEESDERHEAMKVQLESIRRFNRLTDRRLTKLEKDSQ